ncbi:MAG: TlpA family protein disulfide reductase [Methylococcales bacterium]|nr:TlpA family protein disulfide reductase [Methylococcales bacterium]
MKANKFFIPLLITGLLITSLLTWQITSITHAPNAVFTTVTGQKIELSNLQGSPVIITFWATDCANCIKEIPHLIELYQQYHPLGLFHIAIAMYYDPPSHVVEMTKARQIPYHVALDLKAEHAKAFGQVQLTPTTFLISPKGNIVMQKTGIFDLNNMKQALQLLL